MPVLHKAKRLGLAFVGPNATVKNRAVVGDQAQILGTAVIAQDATVAGRASVGSSVVVDGTSVVGGDVILDGHVHVGLGAELAGDLIAAGNSVFLTGPFCGGDWEESPIQIVVGRYIVGVDHEARIVGITPPSVDDPTAPAPVLTRWEAYLLAHVSTMLETMSYKTPEEYTQSINPQGADDKTWVEGRPDGDTVPLHEVSGITDAQTQRRVRPLRVVSGRR